MYMDVYIHIATIIIHAYVSNVVLRSTSSIECIVGVSTAIVYAFSVDAYNFMITVQLYYYHP